MAITSQSNTAAAVVSAAAIVSVPKTQVDSAATAAAVTAVAAAAASISTSPEPAAPSLDAAPSVVRDAPRDTPAEACIDPDVWRIHGQDYDLSEFVKDHPGGVSAILLGKGVDCTNMFESYHVFNAPVKRLAKYALVPHSGVRRTESAFQTDLREMLRNHFAGQPKWAHKAKLSHIVLVSLLLLLNAAAWVGWWAGSWVALFTLPGVAWLLMVNAAHDGSHFAMSRYPLLNDFWLATSSPLLYAGSSWRMQHVVLHHQETNVPGCDADIHHMPWSRWHPAIKHGGVSIPRALCSGAGHLLIHIGPFLFSTLMMTIVHPIKFVFYPLLLKESCGAQRLSRHGLYRSVDGNWNHKLTPVPLHDGASETELAMFRVAGAVAQSGYHRRAAGAPLDFLVWMWAVAVVITPWLRFPFFQALAFSLIPHMGASFLFFLVTQVSHVQEVCQRDLSNEPCFLKRQVLSALDYGVESNLVRILTGGLNVQSIHHAIPGLSSSHYTDVHPKFIALCKEHGCMPAQVPTLAKASLMHLSYVRRLGKLADKASAVSRSDSSEALAGVGTGVLISSVNGGQKKTAQPAVLAMV